MNTEMKKMVVRLRNARVSQNLTYDDIQEKTGLSKSTIHRFFSDDLDQLHPRFYTIKRLQEVLLGDVEESDDTLLVLKEQLTIKDRQIERLSNIVELLITGDYYGKDKVHIQR